MDRSLLPPPPTPAPTLPGGADTHCPAPKVPPRRSPDTPRLRLLRAPAPDPPLVPPPRRTTVPIAPKPSSCALSMLARRVLGKTETAVRADVDAKSAEHGPETSRCYSSSSRP